MKPEHIIWQQARQLEGGCRYLLRDERSERPSALAMAALATVDAVSALQRELLKREMKDRELKVMELAA